MIYVLDNFHPNFNEYKKHITNVKFENIYSQNKLYNDVSLDCESDNIYKLIKDKIEIDPINKLNFVRAYRDSYENPTWIHSDILFSDYIGVFFIQSSDSIQDDGFCVWKNKQLNDIQLYTKNHNDKINKIIDEQSLDSSKWELWKNVEFKENRLVVCPASYFHSKSSYKNSGNSFENYRIVQVLFFNKRSA